MSYTVLVTATAEKTLSKLSRQVKDFLVKESLVLEKTPYLGEQLNGELRRFRSLHLKYANTHYRIVYEVNDQTRQVVLRVAGVRENFYKRLKSMKLKPVA